MATFTGTSADNNWTVVNPGTFTLDGLGGTDTLYLGTSLRSAYTITRAADGAVHVDSVSGASAALHATLYNMEVLVFDNKKDTLDLASHFGVTPPPPPLVGTSGDDRLTPAAGVTRVDGAGGIDTVVLGQPAAAYQLKATASGFALSRTDGSSTLALAQVERLQFTDRQLALDLGGHAGLVARILGAVFGADAVKNAEYVGIGLRYADGGMADEALVQLALDARLGTGASAADVVNLLYTNVVGQAPGEADRAAYVALLDNHSQTPGSLGLMAATTSLNDQHIDLVGLAGTGLLFTG